MGDYLKGKRALVTGGSTGIGLAVAKRLIAAGAEVVISGRNVEAGAVAEVELRRGGREARFIAFDAGREESVRALIDGTTDTLGGLDILVNNAGPNGRAFGLGLVHELPSDDFDACIKVGLYGPFWCCKYALPVLTKAAESWVVNISAVVALRAAPKMTGYAIAKNGLEALTRQVANDYGGQGVRANAVVLGTMRAGEGDISTLPEGFDAATLDRVTARTTMVGHVGSYADAADAVLFLLSPGARFITGVSLPVDGGGLAKLAYPDYTDVHG